MSDNSGSTNPPDNSNSGSANPPGNSGVPSFADSASRETTPTNVDPANAPDYILDGRGTTDATLYAPAQHAHERIITPLTDIRPYIVRDDKGPSNPLFAGHALCCCGYYYRKYGTKSPDCNLPAPTVRCIGGDVANWQSKCVDCQVRLIPLRTHHLHAPPCPRRHPHSESSPNRTHAMIANPDASAATYEDRTSSARRPRRKMLHWMAHTPAGSQTLRLAPGLRSRRRTIVRRPSVSDSPKSHDNRHRRGASLLLSLPGMRRDAAGRNRDSRGKGHKGKAVSAVGEARGEFLAWVTVCPSTLVHQEDHG